MINPRQELEEIRFGFRSKLTDIAGKVKASIAARHAAGMATGKVAAKEAVAREAASNIPAAAAASARAGGRSAYGYARGFITQEQAGNPRFIDSALSGLGDIGNRLTPSGFMKVGAGIGAVGVGVGVANWGSGSRKRDNMESKLIKTQLSARESLDLIMFGGGYVNTKDGVKKETGVGGHINRNAGKYVAGTIGSGLLPITLPIGWLVDRKRRKSNIEKARYESEVPDIFGKGEVQLSARSTLDTIMFGHGGYSVKRESALMRQDGSIAGVHYKSEKDAGAGPLIERNKGKLLIGGVGATAGYLTGRSEGVRNPYAKLGLIAGGAGLGMLAGIPSDRAAAKRSILTQAHPMVVSDYVRSMAYNAKLKSRKTPTAENQLSARDQLNTILFNDPRPRDKFGQFKDEGSDQLDPEAIKATYGRGDSVSMGDAAIGGAAAGTSGAAATALIKKIASRRR